MNQTVSPLSRSPFQTEPEVDGQRNMPIPPTEAPKQEDRMDVSMPLRASPGMAPPGSTSSPEGDHEMQNTNGNHEGGKQNANDAPPATNGTSNNHALSAAAAATSQQPKVVQTAFIHKLYNMLEDQSIRHLISWSSSNESFVMSPSQDFSKVLSQYFKHTNISSFVRQLNMYGFHKVSDVFHTGAPESTLWEFKHGQGNFKRGDLAGLREIKRRASRHALIHRDSFSSPHKPSVSQPGTPAEPVPDATGDPRLVNIEHALLDVYARLSRTEETNIALSSRCAMLSDSLGRAQQVNNDLSQIVMKMIPDQSSPLFHDLTAIQKDISRNTEVLRTYEESHDPRQIHFGGGEVMPLSPRQIPQDERRASIHGGGPPRTNLFRQPHAALSPRRYGSIGTSAHVPSYHRPSVNIQPPHTPTHTQHPLATVAEPGHNLARRHTSADIRDTAGWPPQGPQATAEGGPVQPLPSAAQWPPSPESRAPPDPQAQQIRETLASYDFGRRSTVIGAGRPSAVDEDPAPHQQAPGPPPLPVAAHQAQQQPAPPPPLPQSSPFFASGDSWSFQAASQKRGGVRFGDQVAPESTPVTRRTSLASNVHSLLNPAADKDAREDLEGYADGGVEERKRKRVA